MSTTARPTPWRTTYTQLLRSAGPLAPAPALRRSLLALALAGLCQGFALACLYPLFDAAFAGAGEPLRFWLLSMAGLALIAAVLRWYGQGFDYNGRMAAATHALRTRLGEQLRRMPLELLQDKRAGELNATLLGNVDENLNYTLTIFNLICQAILSPLAVALAVLLMDWRLGVILLLLFPTILPLYRWRRPGSARGMRVLDEAHHRTHADIVEYTQGLPVLRAARCEGEKAQTLQESFRRLESIQTIGQRKSSGPKMLTASIIEIGLMLLLTAGIAWVVQGSLSLPVLAATLVIVARFTEPLSNFITYTVVFDLIEAALERIEALLAVPALPQRSPPRKPEDFSIVFDGVHFRYAQGREAALENFSATLPARGMTALVGPSGAGKSTVTRLLLRHADPQQGSIRIGGADLRQIAPEQLNALVSVVFQDVYLFDDSILSNVRMARPEASDGEVLAALEAAQCQDFVARLAKGWHTRLGDIGGRLSGGERQRLSIARALLKDAPIVVLDEPTAALDSESEVAVQRAIDRLVRDKTVIVIAHRLSTIAAAQQILVIDGGRLVEQGHHEELLAVGGRYRSMWEAQHRAKEWHLAGSRA